MQYTEMLLYHFYDLNRYVETEEDPATQIKLITDDSYTQQTVLKLISNMETYHKKQPYLLKCLHNLVMDLPSTNFGKQVGIFHIFCHSVFICFAIIIT